MQTRTITSIVSIYSSSLISESTSRGVGDTDGDELKLEISLEGDPSRDATKLKIIKELTT